MHEAIVEVSQVVVSTDCTRRLLAQVQVLEDAQLHGLQEEVAHFSQTSQQPPALHLGLPSLSTQASQQSGLHASLPAKPCAERCDLQS